MHAGERLADERRSLEVERVKWEAQSVAARQEKEEQALDKVGISLHTAGLVLQHAKRWRSRR